MFEQNSTLASSHPSSSHSALSQTMTTDNLSIEQAQTMMRTAMFFYEKARHSPGRTSDVVKYGYAALNLLVDALAEHDVYSYQRLKSKVLLILCQTAVICGNLEEGKDLLERATALAPVNDDAITAEVLMCKGLLWQSLLDDDYATSTTFLNAAWQLRHNIHDAFLLRALDFHMLCLLSRGRAIALKQPTDDNSLEQLNDRINDILQRQRRDLTLVNCIVGMPDYKKCAIKATDHFGQFDFKLQWIWLIASLKYSYGVLTALVLDHDVSRDTLTDEHMLWLAGALRHPNCKLTTLNFGVYPLNREGAEVLAKILKVSRGITQAQLLYASDVPDEIRADIESSIRENQAALQVTPSSSSVETTSNVASTSSFIDMRLLDLSSHAMSASTHLATALKQAATLLLNLIRPYGPYHTPRVLEAVTMAYDLLHDIKDIEAQRLSARALLNMSTICLDSGDLEGARVHFHNANSYADEVYHDAQMDTEYLITQALLEQSQGAYSKAIALLKMAKSKAYSYSNTLLTNKINYYLFFLAMCDDALYRRDKQHNRQFSEHELTKIIAGFRGDQQLRDLLAQVYAFIKETDNDQEWCVIHSSSIRKNSVYIPSASHDYILAMILKYHPFTPTKLIIRNQHFGAEGFVWGEPQLNRLFAALQHPNCRVASLSFEDIAMPLNIISRLATLLPSLKLTTLDLSNKQMTDETVSVLITDLIGSPLISLNLSYNAITIEGLKTLLNALPQCQITELNLTANAFGDEGLALLAQYLATRECKLTSIIIGDNNTTAQGIAAFLLELQKSQVSHLDIILCPSPAESGDPEDKKIPSEVVHALATLLTHEHSPLTSLKLNRFLMGGVAIGFDNQLELADALVLANAIKLSKLGQLDLYLDRFDDLGVASLASFLPGTQLNTLILTHQVIGVRGATALAKALPHSQLNTLILANSSVEEEGAKALAAGLKDTPSITCLDLSAMEFTIAGERRVISEAVMAEIAGYLDRNRHNESKRSGLLFDELLPWCFFTPSSQEVTSQSSGGGPRPTYSSSTRYE